MDGFATVFCFDSGSVDRAELGSLVSMEKLKKPLDALPRWLPI
jgi:hypothetical protein